jgi:uncharacterized protein
MSSPATIPQAEEGQSAAGAARVRRLNEMDYGDVAAFLASRPQQGVLLASLIADHGLTSPALRGVFFGHFEGGRLTGVALAGHQTLFCAPDEALGRLAEAAAESGVRCRVIFGPLTQADLFWRHLEARGGECELARDFSWHVCEQPARPVREFRLIQAGPEHLEVVAEAQASMFAEATGNDPRGRDPVGFHRRALERIERGRTWVRLEGGRVIFKAELQSVTPDAIYLEGIWTHPGRRGRGVAKEGVVELTHRRLRKEQAVCLVIEPGEAAARHIYEYAGFSRRDDYRAVYLRQPARAR